MKLYAIHDAKAETYLQPWNARANGEAIRTFSQLVTDTSSRENQFAMAPADFTLFEIGEFDQATGKLIPITPKSLGNGVDFQAQQQ